MNDNDFNTVINKLRELNRVIKADLAISYDYVAWIDSEDGGYILLTVFDPEVDHSLLIALNHLYQITTLELLNPESHHFRKENKHEN